MIYLVVKTGGVDDGLVGTVDGRNPAPVDR